MKLMYDVITIGTATYDVFLMSELFKPIKDKHFNRKMGFPTGQAECFTFGGKIEINAPVMESGGGATNAAVTFARQGLKTAAIYKMGADEFGDLIENSLKKEKVVSMAARDKKLKSGYSTILLSPMGERSILVYRGAACCMESKDVLLNKLKTKWLYIVPSTIAPELIRKVVDYGDHNKILMAMNPSRYYIELGRGALEELCRKIKVIIMNREEAAYLTEKNFKNKKQIFNELQKIFFSSGKRIIVMTDGADGVWVSDGERVYQAGIFKEQKIVDRTGAGDAFGSGFVAGLSQMAAHNQKEAIEYAMRLGSANATAVVEKIGAKPGILTKEEFKKNKRWQRLGIKIL